MDAITSQNKGPELQTRREKDITLSEHVRLAVDKYVNQLDGHPPGGLYAMVISEVERPLIEAILEHSNQNQTTAAHALGISRSTLRKKIIEYNIK